MGEGKRSKKQSLIMQLRRSIRDDLARATSVEVADEAFFKSMGVYVARSVLMDRDPLTQDLLEIYDQERCVAFPYARPLERTPND